MRNVQPVGPAARTASGSSAPIHLRGGNVGFLIDVTAASGTSPSLALAVHWSADGQRFFAAQPADTFTAITAPGGAAKWFAAKAPICRLTWTITGTTPSFTFAVDACMY